MQTGTLRIELTAGGALPVTDAVVRVKDISGELIYEQTLTLGSEGISNAFELEAPDADTGLNENEIPAPYALYNVEVLSGDFARAYVNGVQIFAGEEAILIVPLQPDTASFPSANLPETFVIPPSGLRLPPQPAGDESTLLPKAPASQLHSFPFIPEYITVHLGNPTDFSAKNVTVTFQDYIKNVASSEIYPTWPEEAIRANIIAQISFVLNRVFTEWYRSRGYTFDITNTTAFDQYFVEGRNIFKNISEIVDEIFNIYITKPGNEEPFFARYCNGTTSKCDGLSQWGTVSLANDGMNAEEILRYYYGDIDLIETDDLRGPFESYPGTPLRDGSSGEPVRAVQERLNRIAINYPSIPFIAVNGTYSNETADSVRQFQRIFNLDPDGVVGKATWYAISRIYVAVKNLAELTSEGERADYASQEYPGRPLKLGDKGVEVLEIQLYLSTIALYNNEVKTVAIDGVYGESTLNSVVSFQRSYGIDPDGVVGRITWERLVDVYNGIKNNVNVPSVGTIELQPYPGTELRVGSESGLVAYVSRLINAIASVYPNIPTVEVSDTFTPELEESVKAFQELVTLPATGVIDERTWNYLNDTYRREATSYITDLGSRPYPGRVIKRGDRGVNVRYIQASLNRLSVLDPEIERVRVDSDFGASTENAVKSFQRLYGLFIDGAVDELTWNTLNEAVSNLGKPVTPRTIPAAAPEASAEPSKKESSAQEPVKAEETSAVPEPGEKHTEVKKTKKLGRAEPFERPLRVGSVGKDVEKMKNALCEKGYLDPNAACGDIYGIATRRAVEMLQRAACLTPTGRVDEATWNEIFS